MTPSAFLGRNRRVKGQSNPMILQENFFVKESESIQLAIQKIDENSIQGVFVLSPLKQLVGVLTDGDIRRAILKNIPLTQPVAEIMNRAPKFLKKGQLSRQSAFQKMLKDGVKQLPVVDSDGQVVEVMLIDEFLQPEVKGNKAMILAGGLGSRLRPLTDQVPKPLLPVGDRTILDIQVENFINQGFQDLVVSVNYKSDMIKGHLGDGQNLGCKISYQEEVSPLGTAGPLKLMISEQEEKPVLLINGDIITRLNFSGLLKFHEKNGADLTVCVKEYEIQVPYGVVRVNEQDFKIEDIDEKPLQKVFVNAGIYAINPKIARFIPEGRFDMPDLMKELTKREMKIVAYPIREYWLDIGKMEDYKRAQLEYSLNFKEGL